MKVYGTCAVATGSVQITTDGALIAVAPANCEGLPLELDDRAEELRLSVSRQVFPPGAPYEERKALYFAVLSLWSQRDKSTTPG